jgi:hypothetical protein
VTTPPATKQNRFRDDVGCSVSIKAVACRPSHGLLRIVQAEVRSTPSVHERASQMRFALPCGRGERWPLRAMGARVRLARSAR